MYSDFVTNSYGESWESQIEMLGPLCNQTVNMETDAKTLFYTLLKKEITHTGYSTPKNLQIDGSFFLSHRTHTIIILHLWRSLCIRDAGRRDNKITACTADVHDILQLFIPRFK